jgi:D-sedoheptulose 7-phosphate isomerase
MTAFVRSYLDESIELLRRIDVATLEQLIQGLAELRERGGRLFVLGVGGSAGHATHAVNDLRKLCRIEAYAPTDNVCELTARVNDEGWDSCFERWLEGSRLGSADGLLVLSVGGGSREHRVSMNLVGALELAARVGASVFGIVRGRAAPLPGAHYAPHRRAVQRAAAPGGQPPGAQAGRDEVGVHHAEVSDRVCRHARPHPARRRHARPDGGGRP